MLVFVLNAGSSSLKYQLRNPVTKKVLASGICERIGIDGVLKHEYNDGKKLVLNEAMPTHKEAINAVLTTTYRDWETDRKSTRLNSSHRSLSRMPASA